MTEAESTWFGRTLAQAKQEGKEPKCLVFTADSHLVSLCVCPIDMVRPDITEEELWYIVDLILDAVDDDDILNNAGLSPEVKEARDYFMELWPAQLEKATVKCAGLTRDGGRVVPGNIWFSSNERLTSYIPEIVEKLTGRSVVPVIRGYRFLDPEGNILDESGLVKRYQEACGPRSSS